MNKLIVMILMLLCFVLPSMAQLTVLNVPSVDITEKGKTYVRFDTYYNPVNSYTLLTPNVMHGIGYNVDLGMNVESFNINANSQAALVPNAKWKVYQNMNGGEGLEVVVGDKVYIPVTRNLFDGGNYMYALAAMTTDGIGRVSAGIFNSQNVFGSGNRTGALLALEHPLTKQFMGAIDWQSGAMGQTTVGLQWNPNKRVMIIPAYTLGNTGITKGNHGFVLYLGYAL